MGTSSYGGGFRSGRIYDHKKKESCKFLTLMCHPELDSGSNLFLFENLKGIEKMRF